jgi:hypothetical protein
VTRSLTRSLRRRRPPAPAAGLLYAGSLWLSNSSYLYLSVSFIQMTKSLMPGLVFASGVLLGTEKYHLGTALNMTMIGFGVVVCAWGEESLVLKGLIQQLTALMFEVRGCLARPQLPASCQRRRGAAAGAGGCLKAAQAAAPQPGLRALGIEPARPCCRCRRRCA